MFELCRIRNQNRFLQDKQNADDAIRVLKLFSTDKGVQYETQTQKDTTAGEGQHQSNELTIDIESNQDSSQVVIQQEFRVPISNPPTDSNEQDLTEQPSASINVKKPTSEDI